MKHVIDNDVFFAAIYTRHTNHATARRWLDKAKPEGWGIASETYLAAMRLFMNSRVMGAATLDATSALDVVDAELGGKYPGKILLAKTLPERALLESISGHGQIMDVWLVQIARDHKAKLATFDGGTLANWPSLSTRIA
jgi:predicted nucleic acid-binding protein